MANAKTIELGEYIYEWSESDREAQGPCDEPSDQEMATIRRVLRARGMTTETDDRGIRVVSA